MIKPVEESITAPSVGAASNEKVPPAKPVIVAVPPSHVGVISKEESSGSFIWKLKISESPILKQPVVPITSILG